MLQKAITAFFKFCWEFGQDFAECAVSPLFALGEEWRKFRNGTREELRSFFNSFNK